MTSLEDRISALEKRTRLLEDQLAIYQLLAAYGPAVDSLSGDAAAALWVKDGTYEAGTYVFEGREALAGLVDIENHRTWVAQGCAHVVGLPQIAIDGDTAVARGYSRVYLHEGDHWRVHRASANRWELARTPEGWKVTHRVNRLLDGDEAARDLLRDYPARTAPSTTSTAPETNFASSEARKA